MSKKSIIKSILWILFIILLFLGYFSSGSYSSKHHLNSISPTANGIIIVDFREIAKEYYHLFKKNPSELLKLSKDQSVKSIQNPGFNPFSKIVAYTEAFNNNIVFGLIMPDADPFYFFKTFNLKNEKNIIQPNESVNLCIYPQNNAFAFIHNNIGFFIKLIHEKNPITQKFAKNYHNYLINNKAANPSHENNALNKIKNANDHISVWTNSSGFRLLSLNKLFSGMSTSINFEKGKLSFEVDADLHNNNSFTELSNSLNPLNENELVKFTTNVNPELIKSVLSKYIPRKIDSLLNKWDGGLYLSINGFRNNDVLSIDRDTISKDINLPELVIGIQLDNINEIKKSIIDDSTFIRIEDGYYFWITNLLNEKCYLYFYDDHLLLSTKQLPEDRITASFKTFYLNIDFEKLIEVYPPKNIIQRAILNLIQQQVKLQEINLKYNGRTNNTIHLKGELLLGDQDQHKLVEFLEQIKTIPIKDILSSITSSSKLIVPQIK